VKGGEGVVHSGFNEDSLGVPPHTHDEFDEWFYPIIYAWFVGTLLIISYLGKVWT